jgi:hypothetical protein
MEERQSLGRSVRGVLFAVSVIQMTVSTAFNQTTEMVENWKKIVWSTDVSCAPCTAGLAFDSEPELNSSARSEPHSIGS